MLHRVGEMPISASFEAPVEPQEVEPAAPMAAQAEQAAPQAILPPFWHVMVVEDGKAVCKGMTQQELDNLRATHPSP